MRLQIYLSIFSVFKAEHEIRESYLMQDIMNVRHSENGRRFHQHTDLLSYPEQWDWREKGFVTDVSVSKCVVTSESNEEGELVCACVCV